MKIVEGDVFHGKPFSPHRIIFETFSKDNVSNVFFLDCAEFCRNSHGKNGGRISCLELELIGQGHYPEQAD